MKVGKKQAGREKGHRIGNPGKRDRKKENLLIGFGTEILYQGEKENGKGATERIKKAGQNPHKKKKKKEASVNNREKD